MNSDFEYAIVGCGGMGSAAAYYLACAGKSVVVLEQFEIGHNRGASHGESRIIRYSYEWTDYVKLAREAYRLWDELSAESGIELITRTGGLDFGFPGNPDFDRCIESLEMESVEHEVLDQSEIGNRFPQFQIGKNVRGLYQKDAGYLEPDVCVPTLIKLAASSGACIEANSTCDTISLGSDYADIAAGEKSWRVKKLILTPGPWAGPLLAQLAVNLPVSVTLEQYAFFHPADYKLFEEDRFPVWIAYVADGQENLYGFPYYCDLGVKVAEHRAGAVTDASTRSFAPDSEKLERLTRRARVLLPSLTQSISKSATCLYANTPDRHFVIDTLKDFAHVVVAAGFSGHGFKFVPIVGSIVRDLAVTGKTSHPLGLFGLKRFCQAAIAEEVLPMERI